MNAPNQSEQTALAVVQPASFDLSPRNFDEAWRLSQIVADTDLVPKDFQGKPEKCFIAIQWGNEVNLKAMQALQNIAVINGRPSLWGDSMLAIVRASPLCEYFIERWEGSGDDLKAISRSKRRGEPEEQVREYSMADARKADLLGKDTYKKFGKRMLQMRARGWLIRDVYTDLIKGLHMAEEAMDMPAPEKFMGEADVVGAPPASPSAAAQALPEFTQEHLDQRKAKIADFYAKDKTADEVIAFYCLKSRLSDAMKKAIRDLAPKAKDEGVTDAQPKVTYAQLADRLGKCGDRDTAALILDESRALPADQQADLSRLFAEKFGE